MTYDISLATPDDIPGILALQEPNLPDSGGSLSVRLTADWFKNAILEKSVVAGRRDSKVVGYVLGTSLAAKAHVGIPKADICSAQAVCFGPNATVRATETKSSPFDSCLGGGRKGCSGDRA